MLHARIVGTAASTIKHASLVGWKMLIAQPLAVDGRSPDGEPVLVVDVFGAGVGSLVMITSDGRSTRELLKSDTTPVRWNVLGIVDD